QGGLIDLRDGELFDERDGQSPKDRMGELLMTPLLGGQNLREALEDLVQSPRWSEAASGAVMGSGGAPITRWGMAAMVIKRYHTAAYAQVRREYPSLKTAEQQALRVKPMSAVGDKAAVDA